MINCLINLHRYVCFEILAKVHPLCYNAAYYLDVYVEIIQPTGYLRLSANLINGATIGSLFHLSSCLNMMFNKDKQVDDKYPILWYVGCGYTYTYYYVIVSFSVSGRRQLLSVTANEALILNYSMCLIFYLYWIDDTHNYRFEYNSQTYYIYIQLLWGHYNKELDYIWLYSLQWWIWIYKNN